MNILSFMKASRENQCQTLNIPLLTHTAHAQSCATSPLCKMCQCLLKDRMGLLVGVCQKLLLYSDVVVEHYVMYI